MKSNHLFVLSGLMVFGFLSVGSVRADDTRTTTTGAVFTRDESVPALGEAWRDEQGVIWGDIAKNVDGWVRYMNNGDAVKYCTDIGAELPTRDDFISLRTAMGATTKDYWAGTGYTPQVLPNLTRTESGRTNGYYFWSSSVRPDNSADAYDFYGPHGDIVYSDRSFTVDAVRCIVRR